MQSLTRSADCYQWPGRASKMNPAAAPPYVHDLPQDLPRMRADNWRKLICMHNGADIYLNLIYFPYCRLLCQSHINPLIS